MMSQNTQFNGNMSWWIISLAISVVCCAILFVVFAGYLVDIKEGISTSKMRLDLVDQRLNEMNADLENARRRSTVQQIQVIPSPVVNGTQANGQPPTIVPIPVMIPDSRNDNQQKH